MRLCGEVSYAILLTAILSVTARPDQPSNQAQTENEPSHRNIQPSPGEREIRSFSALTREGNEASNDSKNENVVIESVTEFHDVIPVKLSHDEGSKEVGNLTETQNEESSDKNDQRLSRSDDKNFIEQNNKANNKSDVKEIGENDRIANKIKYDSDKRPNDDTMNSYQLYNNNNNNNNNFPLPVLMPNKNNENIEFSGPLDDNLNYYLPQAYDESYDNKLKELDEQLYNMRNKYSSNALNNRFGMVFNPSDEEIRNVMPPQFFNNYNQDYMSAEPQFNFNPTLKDIFNYNPVFEYIRKSSDSDNDEDDKPSKKSGYVKRKIQHYQTVYQPNLLQQYYLNQIRLQHLMKNQNSFVTNDINNDRINQQGDFQINSQNYQQLLQIQNNNNNNDRPNSAINNQPLPIVPNISNDLKLNPAQKIFDDYFPVLIQNPFNSMWTAFTNIVEYGPEADVCKKKKNKNKRRGRDLLKEDVVILKGSDDEDEAEDRNGDDEEDVSEDYFLDNFRSTTDYPNIRRLKVRRGGVAIAGPGGIATAGSGGTAIVGPGGTAYTRQDGTAIVGPGGRLVHVPEFSTFPFFKTTEGDAARTFKDPPGSKFIAMGPLIYYNHPAESSD